MNERRLQRRQLKLLLCKVETMMKSNVQSTTDTVSILLLFLPLSLYTDSAVSDLSVLSRRLFRMESINEGLFMVFLCCLLIFTSEWISVFEDETLSFCQLCLSDFGLEVTYSLTITKDFTWSMTYRRTAVDLSLCSYVPTCRGHLYIGKFKYKTCVDTLHECS